MPPTKRPRSRPRKRPATLHADKADDARKYRRAPTRRLSKARLARKGVERSDRLGRHRRIVARTPAWLHLCRRLRVRDDRHADMHQAFLHPGCALLCFNYLQQGV